MKVAIIYNKDITGVLNTFGMQNKEFYSEENVQKVAPSQESLKHININQLTQLQSDDPFQN